MFSFTRLRGADPTLGVEMHSTGEVACFGHDVQAAFLQALLASTFQLPSVSRDKYILVSISEEKVRLEFEDALRCLQRMGHQIVATPGTATYYTERGFDDITVLEKPGDEVHSGEPLSVLTWIRDKRIDLVINISEGTTRSDEVTAGYLIRRTAVDFGTSLLTNIK